MQLSIIFQVIVAATLTASGVNAELLDKAVYAKDVAPGYLQRIADYRSGQGGSLSSAQASVLDLAEKVTKDFDVGEIGALKAACDAAFGHEKCVSILTGGGAQSNAKRGLLSSRALCGCTDEDDDSCINGYHCQYKSSNCGFYTGCGFLGIYVCNGLCEPN